MQGPSLPRKPVGLLITLPQSNIAASGQIIKGLNISLVEVATQSCPQTVAVAFGYTSSYGTLSQDQVGHLHSGGPRHLAF